MYLHPTDHHADDRWEAPDPANERDGSFCPIAGRDRTGTQTDSQPESIGWKGDHDPEKGRHTDTQIHRRTTTHTHLQDTQTGGYRSQIIYTSKEIETLTSTHIVISVPSLPHTSCYRSSQ